MAGLMRQLCQLLGVFTLLSVLQLMEVEGYSW